MAARLLEELSWRLTPLFQSVWVAATPIRFAGVWFSHVMTAIRLDDGSMLLHSPCRLSDKLQADLQPLGKVAHIVAPNWFHDLYLTDFRLAYPEAVFWAPSMLRRQKGPGIIDRMLDSATRPPWYDEMPHIVLKGLLTFDECLFWHAASRTLIVADFLMNLRATPAMPQYTRFMYKLSRTDGRLAVFPLLPLDFSSRTSLRDAAARLRDWKPERIVVGHGAPVTSDASGQLLSALGWLLPDA